MAQELATAWIKLQPTFEGVQGSITKQLGGAAVAEKAGKEAGLGWVGGAKKGLAGLGAVIGGAFVAKAAADFFADSFKAVTNWQRLNAQTAAVVKSTGSAANVTAEQIHDLAESLEGLTATQAESIQEGANMLLTFKNIRNGVGEGNDIFNQATEALVDMSRAMGSDPQTAAIQLGKALNDPIAGIGALSRVGVQFTEDQKKVIEQLVATGDTAGAQKVILEELNAQFGGSGAAYAETYEGKLFLLQDAFGDIGEAIVTDLMPFFDDVLKWLSEDGIKAVEDFVKVTGDLTKALGDLSEEDWFQKLNEELASGGSLDLATGGFVENFKKKWEELPSSFENGWEQIKAGNVQASDDITKSFEDSWNSRWLPAATNGWTQITDAFGNGWEQILAMFNNGGNQIATWWNGMWAAIGLALGNGWAQITGAFANGWEQITGWWNSMWAAIGAALANGWAQITAGVAGLWSSVTSAFSNGWNQIVGFVTGAAKTITDTVNGILRTFEDAAKGIRNAFDGIGKFIKDAFGPVADFLGGAGKNIANFFGGMGDRARTVKGKLKDIQPMSTGGFVGGAALARVTPLMRGLGGLKITDTLSNRATDAALGLPRSVNSYHYDASNPAVDIAGPNDQLWQLYRRIMAVGGWRQILWQVAGHFDHIHVAHSGGVVASGWRRMPGDKPDERTVRLQVGETVLPRAFASMRDGGDLGSGGMAAAITNYITTPPNEDPRIIARGLARELVAQMAGSA